MCLHPVKDDIWVSGSIAKSGRWAECDRLTTLIREDSNSTHPVHIEIGANIGACLMQVLLSTNATILAFEPDPRNLFVLTSTLMKLDSGTLERVNLFPIALGAESGNSTIHVAATNRGNAIVSQAINDSGNPRQQFLEPMPIQIERVDDILGPNYSISLIKMDAQGFECYIVRGMQDVLRRAKSVVFELEKVFLDAFPNCSSQVLWDEVKNTGFEMFSYSINPRSPSAPIPNRPPVPAINILARNKFVAQA